MNIIVSQEIENVCPGFVGAAVEAQVVNSAYCAELWDEIHALEARFRQELTTESLKEQFAKSEIVASGFVAPCVMDQPTLELALPSNDVVLPGSLPTL